MLTQIPCNYRYDYHPLEELLATQLSAEDLWQSLDELLLILVDYLYYEPNRPIETVSDHYYKVRELRNVFDHLRKQ